MRNASSVDVVLMTDLWFEEFTISPGVWGTNAPCGFQVNVSLFISKEDYFSFRVAVRVAALLVMRRRRSGLICQ